MTLAVAFIAGLVSCLSPCVLPVVPVFAGYVAGGAGTAWSSSAAPTPVATASGSATWRAVGFLLGFLGVFVALWASIGVVGFTLMSTVPLLRQLTGALIIVMGLLMIAGRHPTLSVPARLGTMGRGGPLLLGAGVAVGWTPCIGPTLGAILAWPRRDPPRSGVCCCSSPTLPAWPCRSWLSLSPFGASVGWPCGSASDDEPWISSREPSWSVSASWSSPGPSLGSPACSISGSSSPMPCWCPYRLRGLVVRVIERVAGNRYGSTVRVPVIVGWTSHNRVNSPGVRGATT